MEREFLIGNKSVSDVRHLLVETPQIVRAEDSLDTVLERVVSDPRTRHVYVIDDAGHLAGSIRMNSLIEYLFPYTALIENTTEILRGPVPHLAAKTAGDIMNCEPYYVEETTPLSEVARILIRERINELPVVDARMVLLGQINFNEIIVAYLHEESTRESANSVS